jgi:hypothetical protein
MIDLFDSSDPPCQLCEKLRPAPDHKGAVFQTLNLADLSEIAQTGTCFLCSPVYSAIMTHGYEEPIIDTIYFQVRRDEPFFLMWIETSGASPHLEIFRRTGNVQQIAELQVIFSDQCTRI